jgi:hypothetical protein
MRWDRGGWRGKEKKSDEREPQSGLMRRGDEADLRWPGVGFGDLWRFLFWGGKWVWVTIVAFSVFLGFSWERGKVDMHAIVRCTVPYLLHAYLQLEDTYIRCRIVRFTRKSLSCRRWGFHAWRE